VSSLQFHEATLYDEVLLVAVNLALGLYRRIGYVDHARFLMTKWLRGGNNSV
jgi:hypothetical protein